MKQALLILLFVTPHAWGQQDGTFRFEDVGGVNLPPAEIAGEVESERVSPPEMTGDWPSIASAADGGAWVAWVEWDAAESDRVVVRHRDASGSWGELIEIRDGHWDHYLPAIAATPSGALVAWSAQVDGGYDLFAATVSNGGEVGRIETLSSTEHGDFHVRLAADSKGRVTAVWQSFGDLNADIYARRLADGAWGPSTRISTSSASDWEPSVDLDSQWSSVDLVGHLPRGELRRAARLLRWPDCRGARTHRYRSRGTVPLECDGRREGSHLVAYDTAGPNWGKDFSTSGGVPGSEGLHARRGLGVRVYKNGRVLEPRGDVRDILTGRMSRFAELPTISIDGNGSTWLIFRHWTVEKPHEMYHVYATRLAESGWTTPVRLTNSAGRNTQHTSVATQPEGSLVAAYASDLRSPENLPTSRAHSLHYNVFVAELEAGSPGGEPALEEVEVEAPVAGFEVRQRAKMTVDGKTYTLLLGDCHRHTDIRGHSGFDASTEDTYRYAIDAAQLDYVGPSDHNAVVGGRWPDGLRDYSWWSQQKLVDVYSHEPRFWGIYTYEHSMMRRAVTATFCS